MEIKLLFHVTAVPTKEFGVAIASFPGSSELHDSRRVITRLDSLLLSFNSHNSRQVVALECTRKWKNDKEVSNAVLDSVNVIIAYWSSVKVGKSGNIAPSL